MIFHSHEVDVGMSVCHFKCEFILQAAAMFSGYYWTATVINLIRIITPSLGERLLISIVAFSRYASYVGIQPSLKYLKLLARYWRATQHRSHAQVSPSITQIRFLSVATLSRERSHWHLKYLLHLCTELASHLLSYKELTVLNGKDSISKKAIHHLWLGAF